MDWLSGLMNLLSGLIGAVVGGLMAMWAGSKSAKQQFDYSRMLQVEAEREATRRFLLAIKAEVETIWTGYEHEVGHRVGALQPGEGLPVTYRLRQQYFTVYDTNAQYLGHVEDDELRSAIVRTYTLAKGLIDTHLVNNDLLERMNAVAVTIYGTPQQLIAQQEKLIASENWQAFGTELKTAYQQTKQSMERLVQLLDKSDALMKK